MNVDLYYAKPKQTLQAVFLKGDEGLWEIARWAGAHRVDFNNPGFTLHVGTPDWSREMLVYKTNWLVKHPNGRIEVYTNEAFLVQFDLVNAPETGEIK